MLRLGTFSLIMLALSGCSLSLMPSRNDPSCSWTTVPPPNHDAVCRVVYRTLNAIAQAELHDDSRTIRRLVTNPQVAARILAHTAALQKVGVTSLHVVPSLALGVSRQGYLGAGINVVGTSHQGNIKAPQTVYLRVRGNKAVVVQDQPEQEW